jgi:hypothetical protein
MAACRGEAAIANDCKLIGNMVATAKRELQSVLLIL